VSDLSLRADQLLREARQALLPEDADRLRVLEGLREKLGDAALLGETAGSATVAAPSTVPLISAAVVALGVAGGVLWYALQDSQATPPPPPAAAVAPVVTPAPPAPTPEVQPEPAAPVVDPALRPSAAARRSTLAQEVAIMSRATASLQSGRATEALRLFEEHQQKFPGGVLSEERLAGRVQALCTLGRRAQADAELARLVKASPGSPHVVRARQVCETKR
jgi:hypothetical protein